MFGSIEEFVWSGREVMQMMMDTTRGFMCRFGNRKPDAPRRLLALADTVRGTHLCCWDIAYKIYSH